MSSSPSRSAAWPLAAAWRGEESPGRGASATVTMLQARIKNGTLVADVPPGYAEGEEMRIAVVNDVEHGMTPDEIDALNHSIEQGEREIAEGKY